MDINLVEKITNLLVAQGITPNKISSDRNYWFIRTQGGSYFDEFFLDGFVAIGHEDVPCIAENERSEQLIDQIKVDHPQATRILNQVYRFCKEIKKGDIVIIPSASSASFAFGCIEEDEIFIENINEEDTSEGKCPFTRRRKTDWIRGIPKSRVDSKLYTFFRNQQTLSQVNDYSEFIERAIHPFYIKNDIAHLTLSVETADSPNALDIPLYMQGILQRANELSAELNLDCDSSLVKSRINVQSAGLIELLGDPCFVMLVGIVIVGLFGGTAKFHSDGKNIDGELGTDGLIGAIIKILDKYKNDCLIGDHKMQETQERLAIKDPRKAQKKKNRL